MGMFDYVVCKAPLPGKPPAFVKDTDHRFQSKDFECQMSVYEITADGRLRDQEGQDVEETFSLEFYGGNTVAANGGYRFTIEGEDWEWVCYQAEFVDGVMRSLVETEREGGQALPIAVMHNYQRAENDCEINLSEPPIGATMFLQWGGQPEGYPVTLAVKTDRKWAVTTGDGDIETLHASDFGRLLFWSREDAQRTWTAGEKARESELAYYESLLHARKETPQ